jgi:hypothetical protein
MKQTIRSFPVRTPRGALGTKKANPRAYRYTLNFAVYQNLLTCSTTSEFRISPDS